MRAMREQRDAQPGEAPGRPELQQFRVAKLATLAWKDFQHKLSGNGVSTQHDLNYYYQNREVNCIARMFLS